MCVCVRSLALYASKEIHSLAYDCINCVYVCIDVCLCLCGVYLGLYMNEYKYLAPVHGMTYNRENSDLCWPISLDT